LPAKKISLVNSLRSSISCKSAPDRCFELHSVAEQIQERFVKLCPPDWDRQSFQRFDPFMINGRAMNRGRPIHRGCTHAKAVQPHFCDFWINFLIESSDVLMAAGWDQAAGHSRHQFCAYFQNNLNRVF
jgi:hypothetical protein